MEMFEAEWEANATRQARNTMRAARQPARECRRTSSRDYLRCRIFARMRRFLRPILRRPFPVFFVPTQRLQN